MVSSNALDHVQQLNFLGNHKTDYQNQCLVWVLTINLAQKLNLLGNRIITYIKLT